MAGEPRQFFGDQRRLVVTPMPEPRPVQRHRNDQRPIGNQADMPPQHAADQAGKADFAAMFQLQRNFACDIAVGNRSFDPRMARRIGQTGGAPGIGFSGKGQRQITARAGRLGKQAKLLPAILAKAVLIRRDRAAGRAARRQGKIDENFQRVCQRLHILLVGYNRTRHKRGMEQARPPEIFDPRRRRALQLRAIGRTGNGHFLWDHLADDLADRLGCTTRSFEKCLILGPLAGHAQAIAGPKATEIISFPLAEEDRLGIEPGSFDLIVAAGALDSINDLPGALVQIRRALKPDGLFLGALFGAGTLASLKKAMLLADAGRAMPHIHPQIELRSAADLLARAGFAMQVADKAEADVRYGDWRRLVSDLRDAGIGNCLARQRPYLGKGYTERLDAAWAGLKDGDGKVCERFEYLHLSGWAPSPDQPKAAPRGSGKVSLAALLDKSGKI